ncbi:thermonuclease family protein [Aureimonas leprariae]|uniref:TNase-like domain-containing protein n=1 Tax=Plantimonas leprariae TaxID=2615207 RepID=A0A7V7PKQ3_9HYPH|nr:hypothetical protein [Aureimonas leprariae]KAB0676565.1 hypothetical protein F6X38_21000 [Aureimonas leprariae]
MGGLPVGTRLEAARERLQGTAATVLGLVAIALVFVYLVPRQADIASAMNARWERMRTAAEAREAAEGRSPAEAAVETPAAPVDNPAPAETGGSPDVAQTAAVAPAAPPAAPAPLPAATPPAGAEAELLARPVVLDTATILIRRGKVHLEGIEAAPLSRRCGEAGPRGWFCGVEARTRFRSWLRARSISCNVPKGFGDDAGEVEARCDLSGTDIGGWLVENGFAEAAPGSDYVQAEAKAKAAKLGIWAEHRMED